MSANKSDRPTVTSSRATNEDLGVSHLKSPACRDCLAERCSSCSGVHHDPTCPIGRTLDKVERKDLKWFADRPYAVRLRPVNWAEAASVELQTGFRPSHVHVMRVLDRFGHPALSYGYGDSDAIRVIALAVGGGGQHG